MENEIKLSGFVVQPRLQFKNTKDKMLYLLLLNEANFMDSDNGEAGQATISVAKLADEIGWTRDILRGALKRLVDLGYIKTKSLRQKKGTLVEIVDYKKLQNLVSYKKKGKKAPQGIPKESPRNPQEEEAEIPCGSKGGEVSKNGNPQGKPKESPTIPHITEFLPIYINSINSNNSNNIKRLTEIIAESNVKNVNLSTPEEIEIFVDFALQINAFPNGISRKILIAYFDCIRLTRQTCAVSANVLAKFIEKIEKYSVNQIHYAMWKHVESHDDKKERYTLGILRGTSEPEARRGLIKLKNKDEPPIKEQSVQDWFAEKEREMANEEK